MSESCSIERRGGFRKYTKKELTDLASTTDFNSIDEVLANCSPNEIRQNRAFIQITKLQEKGKHLSQKINTDFSRLSREDAMKDVENSTDSRIITYQQLLDSDYFRDRGATLSQFNINDLRTHIIQQLIKDEKNLTQQDAEAKADKILDHYVQIANDAAILHKCIAYYVPDNVQKFQEHLKEDPELKQFADDDTFVKVLYSSLNNINKKILSDVKQADKGSYVINNINLLGQLQGLDKELFGHIDKIIIDGAGDLHIVLYKFSADGFNLYSAKMDRYKYQMALLQQLLAANGVDTKNTILHLVPVKLKYNNDMQLEAAIVSDRDARLNVQGRNNPMQKQYDISERVLPSPARVQVVNEDLDVVDKQLEAIFVTPNISSHGIAMIPRQWVLKNRSKIKKSNSTEYAWEVNFGPGDTKYIKEETEPENNQELFVEILERSSKLLEPDGTLIHTICKDVRNGIKGKIINFAEDLTYGKSGYFLQTMFSKYFPPDEDTESDWEFIQNDLLNTLNILLIHNKKTGQLDIIKLSSYDLETSVKLKRSSEHILGDILSTMDPSVKEAIHYKPTYANIEAVYTMLIINQILPKIVGNFKLGNLQILSTNYSGQNVPFNLVKFNKDCFSVVVDTLNKFPNSKVNNNLVNYKFIDPMDIVEAEVEAIFNDSRTTAAAIETFREMGLTNLEDAKTTEAKLTALRSIAKRLEQDYYYLSDFDRVKKTRGYNRVRSLYRRVLEAIAYYDVGEVSYIEEKMSFADTKGMISNRLRNKNMQLITELYTRTINVISEKAMTHWEPIRKVFFQFYKDMGYSTTRNAVIGDLVRIFDDLYAKDERGERTLRLLNPYDDADMAQIPQDKREIKRKFLKRVLFEFARIKYPQQGISFDFSSEEDPNLQRFIEHHKGTYFNIPLARASKSTRAVKMSIKDRWSDTVRIAKKIFRHPKEAFEELYYNVNDEEKNYQNEDTLNNLQVRNKFWKGDSEERDEYIAKYGTKYFETNLESLLIDYIEKDIQVKEYQKALTTIKGVILRLELFKGSPNLKAIIDQTVQEITDYVKINIFNKSTMTELSQKILSFLAIPKRIVSDTVIGGHVVGGVRDVFQGTWESMMRVITKFDTNISTKSLNKAYFEVTKNVFKSARSINIISQLCQIYRLSNMDVARISEGLKTDRGIANFKTWLYASLRRPDFFNRMVMFVAHCMEDGVYDAFEIKDGKLVYDWKKDERFSIFASGKTNDPKYKEQMGAYYNAVRAYNADHPDATIGFNPFEEGATPLPMPYSFNEVENIKKVANNIYGSYDRSTRQGMENIFIGQIFGMYMTWMNGIYANWFTKPGTYSTGQFEIQPAKDDSGNPLFFDEMGNILVQKTDENGNVKYFYDGTDTEVTEGLDKIVPVMDKVPIPIQGIFYTLKECGHALAQGTFKKDIWQNKVNQANLKKLISELLAWLAFGLVYKFALTPGFKEFKKGMKERDLLTNAFVELMYKSSSSSYDSFKGLYNIVDYIGNADGTPIYKQNMRLLHDLTKATLGDASVWDAYKGNIAVFKNFQYSISAEMKK